MSIDPLADPSIPPGIHWPLDRDCMRQYTQHGHSQSTDMDVHNIDRALYTTNTLRVSQQNIIAREHRVLISDPPSSAQACGLQCDMLLLGKLKLSHASLEHQHPGRRAWVGIPICGARLPESELQSRSGRVQKTVVNHCLHCSLGTGFFPVGVVASVWLGFASVGRGLGDNAGFSHSHMIFPRGDRTVTDHRTGVLWFDQDFVPRLRSYGLFRCGIAFVSSWMKVK